MDLHADDLHAWLDSASDAELDALSFGVVGIDVHGNVSRYNELEARMVGLVREHVLGRPFFGEVARCMDNSMVAHRIDSAVVAGESLDVSFDYVFALRSRVVPVKLRLLVDPDSPIHYLLVHRYP